MCVLANSLSLQGLPLLELDNGLDSGRVAAVNLVYRLLLERQNHAIEQAKVTPCMLYWIG
jgi:hypothetical protein